MFIKKIITDFKVLSNFIDETYLKLFLTKVEFKNLIALMLSMFFRGYSGKIIDIDFSLSENSKTSMSNFLSKSKLDVDLILNSLREFSIKKIKDFSKLNEQKIYLIIDDTTTIKTKPSKNAVKPIEGCKYHFSNLESKKVYGHQFFMALIKNSNKEFLFDIQLYNSKVKSKISMALDAIKNFTEECIVLGDSWYSSSKIINTVKSMSNVYIGALKTNRLIFLKEYGSLGFKINCLYKILNKSDVDLVTVNNKKYYVYEYVGRLNKIKMAKVIVTWSEGRLFHKDCGRAFICTDIEMSASEILFHYSKRWSIETFFRETKRYFGIDDIQLRTVAAMEKYFLVFTMAISFINLVYIESDESFSKKYIESVSSKVKAYKLNIVRNSNVDSLQKVA